VLGRVSPIEKIVTNKDLTRAMVKARAEHRQSLRDMLVKWRRVELYLNVPRSEAMKSEQDESGVNIQEGAKIYDNQTREIQ